MDSQLTILFTLSFLASVYMAMLTPVIPVYALKLGASQLEIGIIASIGSAVYSLATFASGRLADKAGRKHLVSTSFILYAVSAMLYANSTAPAHLMAVKILEGLAWGMLWPPLESLIGDRQWGSVSRSVSRFGVAWSSGSALGAAVSAIALEVPPQMAFTAASLAAVALAVVTHVSVEETMKERSREIAKISLKLLMNRWSVWTPSFIYAFCQSVFLSLFPAYAEIKGLEAPLISGCLFSLMLTRTVGFWLAGSVKPVMAAVLGAVFLLTGAIPYAILFYYPMLLAGSAIVGLGASLVYSAAFHEVIAAESKERGLNAGIFESGLGIGYLTGPLIGGALAEHELRAPYAMSAIAALTFLTVYGIQARKSRFTRQGF